MGFAGQPTIQPAQLIIPVVPVKVPIIWNVFDFITVTPEALLGMNRHENFGAAVASSTYTVPDQKELHIGSIVLTVRQSAVAATDVVLVFRLRVGTTTAGNEIGGWSCRTRTETGPQNLPVTLASPLIIPANQQFCFTQISGNATRADVTITGELVDL